MTTDTITLPRRGRPPKVTFFDRKAEVVVMGETVTIPITSKGNIAPRFQPTGPREQYALALVQRTMVA